MNGCGYCEQMKPIWEEIVSKFKKTNPNIEFIVVESKEIERMDNETKEKLKAEDILGFPDLRILTKNGKTSTFESNRTVEDLSSWINTHIPEQEPEEINTKYRSILNRIPTPHPAKNTRKYSKRHLKGGKRHRRTRRTRRTRRSKKRRVLRK
jgi:thiol-disulfide isomerase/thioredoxin